MRLNVLVIDRSPPTADLQGNELIARHVMPLLRAGHRLTLVAPVVDGEEAAARAAVEGMFDEIRLVPRSRRVTALIGWLEPFAARLKLPLRGRVDSAAARQLDREIRRVLATASIDVVHVRQLPMASYAASLGRMPRLLELIDAETLATRRGRADRLRTAVRHALAVTIERRALRSFPIVTVVAEADAVALRRLRPASRVEVVPNGVDTDWFQPDPSAAIDSDSVVFVGAMSFGPNIEAATWFARAVLPILRAARPTARFTIVGRDPTPAVQALGREPGVTVTGQVADVRPYLATAAVVVAPMVSGSGIKNKILEAMAMRRPIVATSLAAEGIDVVPGRDLLLADSPADLASNIATLLDDPARAAELAAAGRDLVERRYTWHACAARYAELYADLAGGRATTSTAR